MREYIIITSVILDDMTMCNVSISYYNDDDIAYAVPQDLTCRPVKRIYQRERTRHARSIGPN